jgi:hypothetical protein
MTANGIILIGTLVEDPKISKVYRTFYLLIFSVSDGFLFRENVMERLDIRVAVWRDTWKS